MNNINPKKLINSKWTAVTPKNKEKHFIISEVKFDEEGIILSCKLQAVMTKRSVPINWHDLKNDSTWIYGWK